MSSTIHMDTELVRSGGRKILETAAEYTDLAQNLKQSASSLDMSWEGPSATGYVRDLQKLVDSILTHSNKLEELGGRLLREVDEWINADQFGTAQSGLGSRVYQNLPAIQGPKPSFLMGFGIMVMDGIHYSLGVVRDQWNRALDATGDAARRAIAQSDQTISESLGNFLGKPSSGGSRSVRLELGGDVSIPGIVVGAPLSGKLAAAKEAELISRDGKYYLKLSNEVGAGIEEPLLEAKAKLKIGSNKIAVGVDASTEAMLKGRTEVEYEFDPSKPGDMTKMAAFMFGLGVTNSVTGPLASPPLAGLKDNLHSIKMGQGVEAEGKISADALIKLTGAEGKVGGMQGGELRKNNAGNWEIVQQRQVDASIKGNILTVEKGVDSQIRVESIRDLTTGRESAKVVVELRAEEGRALGASDMEKYVPELKKSDLHGMSGSSSQSQGMRIEYVIDSPADQVKNVLENPSKGLNAIQKDSVQVEVYSTTDLDQGVGVEGKVGAAMQKIGVNIEANAVHSSETRIYP